MTEKKEQKKLIKDNNNPDISKLRLTQDYANLNGVKKEILTVPVRKPGRQDFVRVRSGDEWYFEAAVLELKEDKEIYIVDPVILHEIPGETVRKALYPTINRQGVFTLWPIKLPNEERQLDGYNQSALEAAEIAKSQWIRVASNQSLGAYEVFTATGNFPEPTWPEKSMEELVGVAFKGKIIQSVDHIAIQRLLGIK
jgi:hypothetical protein